MTIETTPAPPDPDERYRPKRGAVVEIEASPDEEEAGK